MKENKKIITEDVTPTWQEVVDIYIEALQNGDDKGREAARQEIRQMAKISDAHNELVRRMKQTDKHATFNNYPHRFITLTEDNETVSVLTKGGKQLTMCVMESANCVDIHFNNPKRTVDNGEPTPVFKMLGFHCGDTPFKGDVTLATILLND